MFFKLKILFKIYIHVRQEVATTERIHGGFPKGLCINFP